MRYLYSYFAAAALVLSPGSAWAEALNIELGQPLAKFANLQPSTRLYLRYRVGQDGVATPMDLQRKEIRFEQQEGKRRLRIVQHWQSATGSLDLDSLFEDRTFRPIIHQRDRRRDGALTREGFAFHSGEIVGLEGQPENIRKDFRLETPLQPFNFETDLETLQTFRWDKDAEFRIVFYHPGGAAPAPYLFRVSGEERIDVGGAKRDCWVVTTDYNAPDKPPGRFWIAKDTQIVVRTAQLLDDGTTIVKALIFST